MTTALTAEQKWMRWKMGRLVDANELKRHFPKDEDWDYPVNTNSRVVEIIDNAPTVDAVEVVRCKDCKYAHMTYGGECKSCDMWKDDDDFTMTLYLDGDFYCAFAERREDGKTD